MQPLLHLTLAESDVSTTAPQQLNHLLIQLLLCFSQLNQLSQLLILHLSQLCQLSPLFMSQKNTQ